MFRLCADVKWLEYLSCEELVDRYFDVEWLDVSDAIDVDVIDADAIDADCCKTTETVIVRSWLIISRKLQRLSFAKIEYVYRSRDWLFHRNCNNYRLLN